MASLTPGVLLKLLQSMDTDTKVTGEHRSAVLQVIGIVPALTASTADDLWPSHGFYLQLSDSVHSTYVSLSSHDADSILSSRSQLGQLVHVDRLISASPVPKAEGLRPVPSSRPHPFIGSPEQLVVHTSPTRPGFVIQPASPTHQAPPLMPSSNSKRTVFAPKENLIAPKLEKEKAPVRRRSGSPAPGKLPNTNIQNSNTNSKRSASPAVRSVSPVPSKCVVPSLVAAKEENRRTAKEPAIVVPSRYRQPSPVARKGSASPAPRRASVSPGRRLSGAMKMSPAPAADGVGKKRAGLVVAGISKVSDAILGSAKSVRKSWDDSSIGSVISLDGKEKAVGGKSKVNREALLRTQVAMSRRLSDVSNDQSSTDDKSEPEKAKPTKKSGSTLAEKTKPGHGPKISLHDRKWTDGSIPLEGVPDCLAKLGKDAIQRRDAASAVAAEALQEALIIEAVLRNLSKFSDLCQSSKVTNPIPAIDQFLAIYTDLQKWQGTLDSLSRTKTDISPLEKSASLWVEAALATDLEVLQFVRSSMDSISKHCKLFDKSDVFSVDQPRTSVSKRQPIPTTSKGHLRVSPVPTPNWNNNSSLNGTLDLARVLRREMQIWFLKFVNEALDMGFVLIGEKEKNCGNSGKVTMILSQFKKINDWLDGVGKLPEEESLKEKIDKLKRKIYGFVISHMGSALDGSVSVSDT
ncbi:dicer-like protein (DUF936) [Rhynchospora pubera]|uniref:Dicer-like protein (DUF936) n=1 Tax=Rhynchospora pubera TaxID=906938 RepID=A0AAV8F7C7_9POAL|nr:dicer-like protein (DUF936) [Rhynchospora pubera]